MSKTTYEQVVQETAEQTMKNCENIGTVEVKFYPTVNAYKTRKDSTAFYSAVVTVGSHKTENGYNSLHISGYLLVRLVERMKDLGLHLASIGQFQRPEDYKEFVPYAEITFFSD